MTDPSQSLRKFNVVVWFSPVAFDIIFRGIRGFSYAEALDEAIRRLEVDPKPTPENDRIALCADGRRIEVVEP